MSGWARKRFWTNVAVTNADGGYGITLDDRPIKTPAKSALIVPTHALARIIADEWAAQGDSIAPETMPATRAANSALDKVSTQFDDVAHLIAAYAETDLVCYRATTPAELVQRQAWSWDPLLDWAASRYGVTWSVVQGVMPRPQPPHTVATLRDAVASLSAFELTAFHDLVAMSGSLVIGFAVTEGVHPAETLWTLSRIDEDWQTELWGPDDEAQSLAQVRRQSFLDAARFFAAVRAA